MLVEMLVHDVLTSHGDRHLRLFMTGKSLQKCDREIYRDCIVLNSLSDSLCLFSEGESPPFSQIHCWTARIVTTSTSDY